MYAGAKAGLTNFTRALGAELGPKRIWANTLAPDTTPSEGNTLALPPESREKMAKGSRSANPDPPLRRRVMMAPGGAVFRITVAALLVAIFDAASGAAADQTARFIKACGKPDRDVTVLDSYMPPQRTLFYDRAGFTIVFDLPKQPQGPLPAPNNRWYWPTIKPPYQWRYERVDKKGYTWACADETILPYCHIEVPEECQTCYGQWCPRKPRCKVPDFQRRCDPPPPR